MKLTLRDYQEDAHARTAEAEQRGVRKQLGVAATGLGKTVIFSSLAEKRGGRTLILAHRDELITQAVAKVLEVWPGIGATETVLGLLHGSGDPHLQQLAYTVRRDPNGVGIVKAGANDVRATVVVASVQTLSRPKRLAQLLHAYDQSAVLLRPVEPFSLVVVDEAHHSTADSYRAVLKAVRAGEPERAATPEEVDDGYELGVVPEGPLLLGVTATPDRGDGKGLDDLYDEVVWTYDMQWGIRQGYLSDLRGVRVTLDKLDMSGVRTNRGDYDAGQAGRALEAAGYPQVVVHAWLADHHLDGGTTITARGRKTLAFTPTVELATHVAAEFVAQGVPAAWVSGETPLDERRAMLRAFSSGELVVLVNCGVLTEGYDEPGVSCVIPKPTKSRGLYAQMVGRGTRLHPEKDYCLVLDAVGVTAEHSLVTVPSLFGIDPKVRPYREGESLTAAASEQAQEMVRLGQLTAAEAELFAQVRREGLAWVPIHQPGDELRRYIIPGGKDREGVEYPMVVLAQREPPNGDIWTAGLQWANGDKRVLIAQVAMETAQATAEDYVRKQGNRGQLALADTNAAWRKRKPTPGAIKAAGKWRLKVDPTWDAGQLSDALNVHIGRIKARGPRKPKASK